MIPMQPLNVVTQRESWENHMAFRDALDAAMPSTQEVIDGWIDKVAEHFVSSGHIASMTTARNQAAAVVAQLIFKSEYDSLLTDKLLKG